MLKILLFTTFFIVSLSALELKKEINQIGMQKISNDASNIEKLKEIAGNNPYLDDVNYMIGLYYMAGDIEKNIKPDFVEAKKRFEKDSNNLAQANYKIAELYYYGYGVKKDFKKAIEYFNRATLDKFKDHLFVAPIATMAIAQTYYKDLKQYKDAIPYLLEAADVYNKPEAQIALAFSYIKGLGNKKNVVEANYWINKAYFNPKTTPIQKAYIYNYIEPTNKFDLDADIGMTCQELK